MLSLSQVLVEETRPEAKFHRPGKAYYWRNQKSGRWLQLILVVWIIYLYWGLLSEKLDFLYKDHIRKSKASASFLAFQSRTTKWVRRNFNIPPIEGEAQIKTGAFFQTFAPQLTFQYFQQQAVRDLGNLWSKILSLSLQRVLCRHAQVTGYHVFYSLNVVKLFCRQRSLWFTKDCCCCERFCVNLSKLYF